MCAVALLGVVHAESSEEELVLRQVSVRGAIEGSVDCRQVFEIRKGEDDPALKDFMYSAIGWEIDPAADPSRTVAITAQAGMLAADGTFTPDDSAALTVLEEHPGMGSCNWQVTGTQQKVYRLTHTVKENSAVDAAATLYGYLDFSYCDHRATQAEVEAAVLSHVTHVVVVGQDQENPWQPVDYWQPWSGVETDAALSLGDQTTTAFTFSGHGTFFYEYRLHGGTLSVAVDGAPEVVAAPTTGWVDCSLAIDNTGEHTVAFTYTAAGDGMTAAIRNVRWAEDDRFVSVRAARSDVQADLREGPVRSPARMEHVLPFAYSSTNWIGGVSGATAASSAKVTIVQLTGTDPDVTKWTAAPGKPLRVLHDAAGEGEVKWKPKKGVWKATFDILGTSHHEESFFDLRESRAPGMAVILF